MKKCYVRVSDKLVTGPISAHLPTNADICRHIRGGAVLSYIDVMPGVVSVWPNLLLLSTWVLKSIFSGHFWHFLPVFPQISRFFDNSLEFWYVQFLDFHDTDIMWRKCGNCTRFCSYRDLHSRAFLFIFAVICHSSHSESTYHRQKSDILLKNIIF